MTEQHCPNAKEDVAVLTHALRRHQQRERHLEATILEAVRVLEETKRAFKSKRLGGLRQQLLNVLIEHQ